VSRPTIARSSGSESDPGPMPIPLNALIEGFPTPGNGDRHVLVLEKSGCWLYELYKVYLNGETWSAPTVKLDRCISAALTVLRPGVAGACRCDQLIELVFGGLTVARDAEVQGVHGSILPW
jgi:hypothetical protein